MATLVERISLLAVAIKNRINNDVFPSLVPFGGTTGQVLTKGSDAELDFGWVDPSGGGVTIVTGTGDLPDPSLYAEDTFYFQY